MSDRVFFPLMFLIAAAMVLVALQPGADALPKGPVGGANSDYVTITVEGDQLNRVVAGGEAGLGYIERDGEKFLKIESYAGFQDDNPVKGPHFELDSDLESVFADHEVEITLTVRPAIRKGAHAFQANYSTGRDGESGWQTFDMYPDWRDYSFIYRLPSKKGEVAFDYLGLRPVVPEDMRSIEVKRVKFRRFEKRQVSDAAMGKNARPLR